MQKLVQRFPHAPIQSCLVKDKVIMADKPGPFRAPSVVYVWDLSSNLVRKIGIDDFSDPSLFHLDADRDVLVVFQVNWKKYPPEVQQTKWMWKTGELLEKKLFLLSLAGACVDDAIVFPPMEFCLPIHNHKTVAECRVKANGTSMELHLMYDYAVDELSARLIEFPPLAAKAFNYPACLTPDVVYYWTYEPINRPAVYDAVNGITTLLPFDLDDKDSLGRWINGGAQAVFGRSDPRIVPFGDNEVFGLAAPSDLGGLEIWFFNPRFVPDLNPKEHFVKEERSIK